MIIVQTVEIPPDQAFEPLHLDSPLPGRRPSGRAKIALLLAAAVFALSLAGCANGSLDTDPEPDPDLSGSVVISATDGGEAALTAATGDPLYAVYAGEEGVNYQWNKDGEPIDGATDGSYVPGEEGEYTVTASAPGYQSQTSAPVTVADGGLNGRWEGNNGSVLIFDGNAFEYSGATNYSGTFSTSGSTLTFLSSSFGAGPGNFELSGGTLTLSNYGWDDSLNDTYTRTGPPH